MLLLSQQNLVIFKSSTLTRLYGIYWWLLQAGLFERQLLGQGYAGKIWGEKLKAKWLSLKQVTSLQESTWKLTLLVTDWTFHTQPRSWTGEPIYLWMFQTVSEHLLPLPQLFLKHVASIRFRRSIYYKINEAEQVKHSLSCLLLFQLNIYTKE